MYFDHFIVKIAEILHFLFKYNGETRDEARKSRASLQIAQSLTNWIERVQMARACCHFCVCFQYDV